MKTKHVYLSVAFFTFCAITFGQTKEDSLAIKKAALDYIESQQKPNPKQMEGALHPRLVKRTFWKDKATGKDYLRETNAESMILLAENYNKMGDKFPTNPQKDVMFLDVSERTASVKLIADDWIDYMHIVKLKGEWKIVNVLWQYKDIKQH